MTGFSKTLKERLKSKWAKQQSGGGNTNTETNLATRRLPVIEKRMKKLKKHSKKRKKNKKK